MTGIRSEVLMEMMFYNSHLSFQKFWTNYFYKVEGCVLISTQIVHRIHI